MSVRAGGSGERPRVALGIGLAGGAILALIACRSDPVLIGIEDGDASGVQAIGPHPGSDAASTNPPPVGVVGDAGSLDADFGPCFPDGGCPEGSACEVPDAEAGQAGPAECFASGGPHPPSP